ncbi:hypothetical protein Mal48_35880 [Thalassoglobus polymorphus]|uniref:Uncharacterized protein n=1 Tax=Thalassoglobus polymorphus TaxID=2527994 RepID=A0A517QRT4_9PLAN|nr:hypothetical protein Mal48_35880 [Thalassoglobus polymorphus]
MGNESLVLTDWMLLWVPDFHLAIVPTGSIDVKSGSIRVKDAKDENTRTGKESKRDSREVAKQGLTSQ